MELLYPHQLLENEQGFAQIVVLYAGVGHMPPLNRELRNPEPLFSRQPQNFRVEDNTVQLLEAEQGLGRFTTEKFEAALGIRKVNSQV